jgi:hypothetical protein
MMNSLRIIALTAAALTAGATFAQYGHETTGAKHAEKVALAKYHGKLAGKTALEKEDGKWQYAVMVRSGGKLREVMVSAKTGRIASVEIVTAAEEAREKKAEAKHKKG